MAREGLVGPRPKEDVRRFLNSGKRSDPAPQYSAVGGCLGPREYSVVRVYDFRGAFYKNCRNEGVSVQTRCLTPYVYVKCFGVALMLFWDGCVLKRLNLE